MYSQAQHMGQWQSICSITNPIPRGQQTKKGNEISKVQKTFTEQAIQHRTQSLTVSRHSPLQCHRRRCHRQLFCTNSSGHRNGALRFHFLPFPSAVGKTSENGVGGKSRVPYQSISCQQPPPLRTAGQPQPQCTATTQQLPTATISPCFHMLSYYCAVILQAIVYLVIFS